MRLAALVVLGACGRFGFAPEVGTIDGPDATAAPILPVAEPIAVAIGRGTPATRLSVAELPNGAHALAWLSAPSSVFGVAIDAAGAPIVTTETLLTPVSDGGTYADATITYLGGQLLGMVRNGDATMFYKSFPMNADANFLTSDARSAVPAIPAFGAVAGERFGVHVEAGDIVVQTLDGNGQPFGATQNLGFTNADGAAAAGMLTKLAVVGIRAPSHCEGYTVGTPRINTPISTTCTDPHVASRGDDTARVAFVNSATGEPSAAMIAPGVFDPPFPLYDFGTDPRVAHGHGNYCYLWLASGQIHLAIERTSPPAYYFTVIANLPAGDPDAYDVVGATGFALYGSALYRFDACPLWQ